MTQPVSVASNASAPTRPYSPVERSRSRAMAPPRAIPANTGSPTRPLARAQTIPNGAGGIARQVQHRHELGEQQPLTPQFRPQRMRHRLARGAHRQARGASQLRRQAFAPVERPARFDQQLRLIGPQFVDAGHPAPETAPTSTQAGRWARLRSRHRAVIARLQNPAVPERTVAAGWEPPGRARRSRGSPPTPSAVNLARPGVNRAPRRWSHARCAPVASRSEPSASAVMRRPRRRWACRCEGRGLCHRCR